MQDVNGRAALRNWQLIDVYDFTVEGIFVGLFLSLHYHFGQLPGGLRQYNDSQINGFSVGRNQDARYGFGRVTETLYHRIIHVGYKVAEYEITLLVGQPTRYGTRIAGAE